MIRLGQQQALPILLATDIKCKPLTLININFILKINIMLRYTVIFLIIAIIAGILGFGGVAVGAAAIAKIFFYIFVILFICSLVFGNRMKN